MKQHGLAIENWPATRKIDVWVWLKENFGEEGTRWGTVYDYGLDNIWMNEDVYILYCLRWR